MVFRIQKSVVLLAFLCGVSAWAGEAVTCHTESNDLTFTSSHEDGTEARDRALDACESDERTDNRECRTAMICSDGYRGSYSTTSFTCVSNSRGHFFIRRDSEKSLAQIKSVRACDMSKRTDHKECKAKVSCYEDN